MIITPYAEHTATMGGTAWKAVSCEKCQHEYVYQVKRKATGTGTSLLFVGNEGARSRAASEAEVELAWKLHVAVDLVPCPGCGWYQEAMVTKARRLHLEWLKNTGACLAVGIIPVGLIALCFNSTGQFLPWPAFYSIAGAVFLFGIGLILARPRIAARYDPNAADVEARKKLGQSRAMARAAFDKLIQEHQKEDKKEEKA